MIAANTSICHAAGLSIRGNWAYVISFAVNDSYQIPDQIWNPHLKLHRLFLVFS